MRRLPIHTKLAAALAVPLFATGFVTLLEVVNASRDAREVRGQTELATATLGPNGLITALQNERTWAAANLVGVDKQLTLEVTGYGRTRADTDKARAQFMEELGHRGPAASAAYAPALEGLAGLQELRRDIDANVARATLDINNIASATDVFERYTTLIAPFYAGMSRLSIATDDAELREGAYLMETVTRQLEVVPQLANALVLPATVSTGGNDRPGINSASEISRIAELLVAFRRQADTLRRASGPYAGIAARYYPEKFTKVLDQQATQALTTGHIDVNTLLSGMDMPLDQAYLGYRDGVAAALQDRAAALDAAATSRQRWYVLLAVVIFGAAVGVTWFVSLSITRPLRSLTRQAKDMADRRLPEAVNNILETPLGEDVQVPKVAPLRVSTRDEVGDVADALNTVQDSALHLAVEQALLRRNIADSFVNLGRRNQNLLGRQLDFITELESHETDPNALADLFRLDHLATRMRRNAESLLVLAGVEPPRTRTAPVQLGDVIRAALGEVEDYQRVAIRNVDPATVLGSAAADLAHLLAELIENALVFSPPDRTVDIRGRRLPEGYTLAVVDSGLGMADADVATANRRLAGAESFTVAPSKYLGHYVAGHLAGRHGITVRLANGRHGGITATIDVTPTLLDADRDAAPAPPLPDRAPAPAGRLRDRVPQVQVPSPPPTGPSDDRLASLARLAGQLGNAQAPPAPPAPPGREPGGTRQAGRSVRWTWEAAGRQAGAYGGAAPVAPPLARRVGGTQMPTTTPHRLRRAAPAGADATAPGDPQRSAAEVYGFLSTFTAGVRRGLDDARSPRPGWPGG